MGEAAALHTVMFQFHKVRLKVTSLIGGCSIKLFQFHKVRLKVSENRIIAGKR